MILGPLAEAQLRNAMAIGEGKWTVFIERPMSLAMVFVVLAVLVLPRVVSWWQGRKAAARAV
jgi:putative tricarboxylic transport membrane protein